MTTTSLRVGRFGLVAGLACALATGAWAVDPTTPMTILDHKAFFEPELYLSSSHEPLDAVMEQLPNRAAWKQYLAAREAASAEPLRVSVDGRSGVATAIVGSFPLIPGTGVRNRVTLAALEARVGREVAEVDAPTVADASLAFVRSNAALLGIDVAQMGEVRATQVNPDLWQISIPQTYAGVKVRDGRLVVSISHGNVVVYGTEAWGNVKRMQTAPSVGGEKAMEAGFEYAGGRSTHDVIARDLRLEVVPTAPQKLQSGERFAGQVGQGYGHRLVWTFVFQRPPEDARWEVMVDAHSGQVIAFQDVNQYVNRQITGGVYPLTNTGVCPSNEKCGTMQSGWPMPFADTALASPNNFTNSAGIYNYTSGSITTTLTGRYVDIVDSCGAVSNSSTTGNLNLGGTNGQHDCTTGGGSSGNTPASRSAFYEVNKLAEMARGWLPTNTWLQARLTTNVNINLTCNAFWGGGTINFYRSGGGCGNTGEIAAVFDHEWGHGLDDNDAAGVLSTSSEGYADIAAIYRLQASCVGHGFSVGAAGVCGLTSDGTGPNRNENQVGGTHCDLDCSGVRDADYLRHNPNTPDTALGFVCGQCLSSTSLCGRQTHCAAAPTRQAAWDFAARDLQSAPFSLDSQSAFVVANRVFYQGSGNIGQWHACTCGSSSSGCGSTNGYMQWITADDDNGNLNDGTPHMTAIFNAFNRHGIACSTSAAQNSGCASGPATAPTLAVSAGDFSASLSWNAVGGATRYWVFRSEGHAGCNFGKTKIAEVTGTTYVDTQVANGRTYYYNVVAAGASNSCFSRVSNCVNVTPAASTTPDFSVSCSPTSLSVAQGGSGNSTCTVTSTNGFNGAVTLSCAGLPSGASCGFGTNPVTPPANGSANSGLTVNVAGTTATGTYPFQVQGVNGSTTRSQGLSLTVTGPGPVTVFFDNFETSLGWTRNANGTDTATTGLWERGDPEATNSNGPKQLGTTVSGVNDLVTARLAGASAGVNDIDGGVTTIQSPAITLPSTGTLTLTFSYYLAHGTNSSTADFLRVFVVGSTTTQVFQELGGTEDDDAVWANGSANISSFAGQTVRIRIDAADASTASLVEAAVDDVRITRQ